MPLARKQSAHILSTTPAAGAILTNAGTRTTGGMENVGTATSETFTMTEVMTCVDTYSVPINDPSKPPYAPPNVSPYDGTEIGSVPVISLTNISLPTPWTVPATSKSEALSGLGAAPNNTGAGTYDIFPDVKITIGSAVDVGSAGIGVATTTATITGPIKELDDWVVPWTPSDAPPFFDGSDFGLARSSGYGNTQKGGPGIFYITFTLEFSLSEFGTPASAAGTPSVDWGGTPISLDFKIGVINNYDNDRDRYMTAYTNAYKSLTKVPELSEWQT
jgi:hypothetical protein